MDHSVAPILDALTDYHSLDRYGFTPPGHRQGRGADPRTRAAIGEDAFRSDLLVTAGLDDRKSSGGYLSRAEKLMADAVGAEQAFFSTCGSSLSVKAAMLAVAGGLGIPVIVPGERVTAELLEYLRSGLAAGMQLPDPADPSLQTIRVVART